MGAQMPCLGPQILCDCCNLVAGGLMLLPVPTCLDLWTGLSEGPWEEAAALPLVISHPSVSPHFYNWGFCLFVKEKWSLAGCR